MSTPITAWLDEVAARADVATGGPWAGPHDEFGCVRMGEYGWVAAGPSGSSPEYDVDSEQGKKDAEFIAHARADLPQAIAALRAVLDEVATWHGDPYGQRVVRETIAAALEVQP